MMVLVVNGTATYLWVVWSPRVRNAEHCSMHSRLESLELSLAILD